MFNNNSNYNCTLNDLLMQIRQVRRVHLGSVRLQSALQPLFCLLLLLTAPINYANF